MFEHRSQPLLSRKRFRRRLLIAFLWTLAIVAFSITGGTILFLWAGAKSGTEAMYHAILILGEHSLPDHPETPGGRLAVGVYLLYARLVFFALIAFLTAPILHRILHRLHLEKSAGE